jgi:hypothetical protein
VLTSSFKTHIVTDLFVLISDEDREGFRSVTNDAQAVIAYIHHNIADLRVRRVYYQDSMGNIDELKHRGGVSAGFAPCSDSKRQYLQSLIEPNSES